MIDKNKEGLKNILQAINNIIEPKVNTLKYDKTYRGKITRIVDTGVYIVKVKDVEYQVNYSGTLSVGDIVNVKAPLNNFSDIYIETVPGSGGGGTTSNYNDLTNKPQLNTISSTALSTDAAEIIRGTIYLHKISKTGDYNDLRNLPSLNYIPVSEKGANNGVAELDSNGKLVTSRLPSNLVVDADYVHTDNNFTTTLKNKLDGIEDGAEINTIEAIQRNGTALSIQNKTVNIVVPVNTSDLTNNSGFITNSVNNLTNYYLKSDTYTKTEVNDLIGQISTISFEIVSVLPTTGRSNVIYLVPKIIAPNNTYDEYIYINNSWELIGSTDIDLSNYVTNDDLALALSGYATITLLDTGLNGKVDKVTGKGLSSEDYTTEDKNKLTGIENNAEVNVIDTIQKNGESITVTNKTVNISVPTKTSDLTNDTGFLTSEVDPIFSNSIAATIRQTDISSWNNKSDFSGNYNDLTNKPTIPTELADLTDDSTHRTVTDTEKTNWNNKQDTVVFNSTYNPVSNKAATMGDIMAPIDNLNSTSTTDALSANQGRVLNEQKALRSIYNDTNISLGRTTNSSIGTNSIAYGDNVIASGDYSCAIGENNHAIGKDSFATGNGTIAYGKYSTALGGTYTDDMYGISDYVGGEILSISEDRKTVRFMVDPEQYWLEYRYYNCAGCTYFCYYDDELEEEVWDLNNYVKRQLKEYEDEGFVDPQDGSLTIVFINPLDNHLSVGDELELRSLKTIAIGDYSLVVGDRLRTKGNSSFAFGMQTAALGDFSFAGGFDSCAVGDTSYANGVSTTALAASSHAEGYITTAYGSHSHAENCSTEAYGYASHSEGDGTRTYGRTTHSEGRDTKAVGDCSHVEGRSVVAIGENSHASGDSLDTWQIVVDNLLLQGEIQSISDDKKTIVFNAVDVDINDKMKLDCRGATYPLYSTFLADYNAVSEVYYDEDDFEDGQPFSITVVFIESTEYDLSVGDTLELYKYTGVAAGENSFSGGLASRAMGENSFAYGEEVVAFGEHSQAFGGDCQATGDYSNAFGVGSIASGYASHAEGDSTVANGAYSHAEGTNTIASGNQQHVQGQYNIEDNNNEYAHIIGNGTNQENSNAHTVDWQGNAWYSGDVYTGSTSGTNKDAGSKKLATEDYVNTQLALRTLNSYSQNLSTSLSDSSWQTVNPTDYTINLPQGTYRFLISVSFNNASSGLATLRPFINGSEIATSIRTTFPLQSGLDLSAQVEGYTALNGNTSFNAQIYSNVTMTATSITIYVERIN